VLFSAVGPLVFAWCVTVTGSYAIAFYLLAATVAVLGMSAAFVRIDAPSVTAA
jgi:hypothetical protein